MPDNLYRRGEVWWGRIQIRGKDIRRSLRTTVLAEAKKRMKVLLEDAERFRFMGVERHTWKEAVVEWASSAAMQIKPSVVKRYIVSLGQIRHILDHLYVDQIDRKALMLVLQRPGVTNATKRRDLTAVSAVLGWCVARNWREDNPARTVDRSAARERRDPIHLPSEEDIEAVIREAPGNFARMIRFAQQTGMREEEIASMERRQVDLGRNAVTLTVTKTNRPRSVPLNEGALGTYAGTPPHVTCKFVFWHEPGTRYLNVSSRFAAISARTKKRADRAGKDFRKFRFHDLRHWFAVDYLRCGGSIYDLQKILGHSSIKTTEIYLNFLTPDEQGGSKRAGGVR